MKHWRKINAESGFDEDLKLLGANERLISISKAGDMFRITEDCDGYFSEVYSKEEMLELIDELKDWLKSI